MVCPPAWSTTARTAGRQCRPRPDRSRAASANPVPATIHTRQGICSWPSTSGRHDCAALVGRKPAHRHALLERHRPRVDQRQAPRDGLGIDVGDLELPTRRRRRRAPADHIQARHGKAVFRPDRPRVFKTATYVRTPQPPPQTNPELRNLHPNRTIIPLCLVQAKIAKDAHRLLALQSGLDDPSRDRPDLHCNFGGVEPSSGRSR